MPRAKSVCENAESKRPQTCSESCLALPFSAKNNMQDSSRYTHNWLLCHLQALHSYVIRLCIANDCGASLDSVSALLQMEFGGECHISGRPYTKFRWRPGNDARYVCYNRLFCQKLVLCASAFISLMWLQMNLTLLSLFFRYKGTIICQEVAKAKNVCQVILSDLNMEQGQLSCWSWNSAKHASMQRASLALANIWACVLCRCAYWI